MTSAPVRRRPSRPASARRAAGRRASVAPPRRRSPTPPANRLVALLAAMVVGLGGIVARLVLLQVRDASAYHALALDQRTRTVELPATRGAIFDRTGRELAMSLPAKAVFADPALVRDPRATARAVASVLDLDRSAVLGKLRPARTPSGRRTRFVYLARGVDPRLARELAARELAGIGFQDESRRHYPAGTLAPQVLGFVGVDGVGLAGLEREHEEVLAGRNGHMVVEADPDGTLIPQGTNEDVPPLPGDDLLVTLDRDIQYRAQVSLERRVRENHAAGGSVIVMDPRTGEILAMATYPWFDPNRFFEADQSTMRNRPVTDVYEPGSVNKVITAAAALEEGVIDMHERLVVPDRLRLHDKVFHDAHPHAPLEMTLGDVIAHSSNVGAIRIAERLGKERLAEYLERFGFGRRSGVGFPGEAAGILAPPDRWWGTSMGTIPIGQGIAVTPLQMAAVYATIANGGVWIQPRLVRGTVGRDGSVRRAPEPGARRVVSARTAEALTRILTHAVDVGTGRQAQIAGFWVAGKTGTARKPMEGRLGYSDRYVASFIGFAPAARPRIVVAAVIDEPSTVFGGVAAAPLFRDVARFALARLRVTPTRRPPAPPHAVRPE